MELNIDYEKLNNLTNQLIKEIKDVNTSLEKIRQDIVKIIRELVEKIKEVIDKVFNLEKTKYPFIKKIIKPYKQPFIKIKARARANL